MLVKYSKTIIIHTHTHIIGLYEFIPAIDGKIEDGLPLCCTNMGPKNMGKIAQFPEQEAKLLDPRPTSLGSHLLAWDGDRISCGQKP